MCVCACVCVCVYVCSRNLEFPTIKSFLLAKMLIIIPTNNSDPN